MCLSELSLKSVARLGCNVSNPLEKLLFTTLISGSRPEYVVRRGSTSELHCRIASLAFAQEQQQKRSRRLAGVDSLKKRQRTQLMLLARRITLQVG